MVISGLPSASLVPLGRSFPTSLASLVLPRLSKWFFLSYLPGASQPVQIILSCLPGASQAVQLILLYP